MGKDETSRRRRLLAGIGFGLLLCALPALADDRAGGADGGATTQPAEANADHLSVTKHSVTINGQQIDYEATAGTIGLKDEEGKPKADFFFVAYVKQPADQAATRPITFVFNGGPGAAAVWLHLGAVGPKRIELGPDGLPTAPPHRLIDNDQSWLDATDLVFIDPVGTGFSRAAGTYKPEDFFGLENDIKSIAEFIRIYLTRYNRWSSPKYLAGESYGTTRAAGLADYLADEDGIDLNGIILISSILNFETTNLQSGNDLPYALYLPSYTAIAIYHGKIHTSDEPRMLQEVSRWAETDYLALLAKGSGLSESDRRDAIERLSRYTGLAKDLIDRCDLRIDPGMFRKKLLADQRLIIGRFDGRISGEDLKPGTDDSDFDPSLSYYFPVYSSTFNDYIRRDLKYDSDLKYGVLNGVGPWNLMPEGGIGYPDVTESLQRAMVGNPHLRVMVAAGWDDLATPFLSANYTFDHLDPTGKLKERVTQTYYPSGHMIYHDPSSLKQLKADVAKFLEAGN
ncbi:MAG: peptidase S10 [Tepidisphaeraceae bacterium]|jgi:carboxypeptidase C (cathepsin A)